MNDRIVELWRRITISLWSKNFHASIPEIEERTLLRPLPPHPVIFQDKKIFVFTKSIAQRQEVTHFPLEIGNSFLQNYLNSQNRLWACLNRRGKNCKFLLTIFMRRKNYISSVRKSCWLHVSQDKQTFAVHQHMPTTNLFMHPFHCSFKNSFHNCNTADLSIIV